MLYHYAVTLREALVLAQSRHVTGTPLGVSLVCGFTPLHLETFLHAHLVHRTGRPVSIATGQYGDLPGNLRRAAGKQADVCAVVIEWEDLDARLGARSLGSWNPADDILHTVRARLGGIREALAAMPGQAVICGPTLPLPPIAWTPVHCCGAFEAGLRFALAEFVQAAASLPSLTVVSGDRLASLSPAPDRHSLRSEITTGFPYTNGHAEAVAQLLACAIAPARPFKGLITDLDDTLWRGIAGEIGPEGVAWTLSGHAQVHGLYQRLLASLAESGVLIGVASKNDPEVVAKAFARSDLIVPARHLFPVEASWQPKSRSVSRILDTWNIAADSVVFIDDNEIELDEVRRVHPEITALRFPGADPDAVWELLWRLRDLFGRTALSREDSLRAESLASGARLRDDMAAAGEDLDAFLRGVEPVIALQKLGVSSNPRAFELVNKTNQFNLNGRRFDWNAWSAREAGRDAFAWIVGYRDKYGPLGEIAVLSGQIDGSVAYVDVWVMSCRAFSRHIEHICLRLLFEEYRLNKIVFDFSETSRNGPLRDFLAQFAAFGNGETAITRDAFLARCPELAFSIEEAAVGAAL